MPTHGFANNSNFEIRSIDQAGFEVEMIQTEEMKSFYPLITLLPSSIIF